MPQCGSLEFSPSGHVIVASGDVAAGSPSPLTPRDIEAVDANGNVLARIQTRSPATSLVVDLGDTLLYYYELRGGIRAFNFRTGAPVAEPSREPLRQLEASSDPSAARAASELLSVLATPSEGESSQ